MNKSTEKVTIEIDRYRAGLLRKIAYSMLHNECSYLLSLKNEKFEFLFDESDKPILDELFLSILTQTSFGRAYTLRKLRDKIDRDIALIEDAEKK